MGDLVKLGTSIFAIESSFWRPSTALSFAFTSDFLVFGSFLLAETTRDLGLLLVSVFCHNGVDGVNWLVNRGTAAILLGRWFARKNRVEIVGTELNSFVIGLANPAAIEGGSAETFESVEMVNRQAVTWIVTLDLAHGIGSHWRVDATVNVDIVVDCEVSI